MVNCPEHLPHNVPPVAFACSTGFSEDNVKDALNKLGKQIDTGCLEEEYDDEPMLFNLKDFGIDDDYDLNDDVDEEDSFSEESETHAKSWKELYESNRLMKNVASVSFNLPTVDFFIGKCFVEYELAPWHRCLVGHLGLWL